MRFNRCSGAYAGGTTAKGGDRRRSGRWAHGDPQSGAGPVQAEVDESGRASVDLPLGAFRDVGEHVAVEGMRLPVDDQLSGAADHDHGHVHLGVAVQVYPPAGTEHDQVRIEVFAWGQRPGDSVGSSGVDSGKINDDRATICTHGHAQ